VAAGFFSAGLGTQVVGSIVRPSSFCGVYGYKPSLGGINRLGSHDFMSQSCQGVLAASLADVWHVVMEIVARTGGDPGYPGVAGPMTLPPQKMPKRLVFLETTGWSKVSPALQSTMQEAFAKLSAKGIEIINRSMNADVAAAEEAITDALRITREVNCWESRWPLNIYAERDVTKLSPDMQARAKEAASMTPDQYRAACAHRDAIRAAYAKLKATGDAIITLSAVGVAPVGIKSTGDPAFAVPGSLLGVPALSLPLISQNGLPVGIQLMGFEQCDADLFAIARSVQETVGQVALRD
jgi:Asp-tRNA(Asn)/Glu-tRNA(Gln) amidotransferase A subunit family amidase